MERIEPERLKVARDWLVNQLQVKQLLIGGWKPKHPEMRPYIEMTKIIEALKSAYAELDVLEALES